MQPPALLIAICAFRNFFATHHFISSGDGHHLLSIRCRICYSEPEAHHVDAFAPPWPLAAFYHAHGTFFHSASALGSRSNLFHDQQKSRPVASAGPHQFIACRALLRTPSSCMAFSANRIALLLSPKRHNLCTSWQVAQQNNHFTDKRVFHASTYLCGPTTSQLGIRTTWH